MRDFFLQPLYIADPNNREILGLIQSKQQHAATSAVGKGRERLIQSPRRASTCRLYLDVIQFALTSLHVRDKLP